MTENSDTWATNWTEAEPRRPWSLRRLRSSARSAYLGVAGMSRRRPGPSLRCLYAHYVYDDQCARFERLLVQTAKLGRFVSSPELSAALAGEASISSPAYHLSFDDGWDNLYRNAVPILKQLGIPATFFVISGLVGASDSELRERWWLTDRVGRPTRTMDWSMVREIADSGFEIGSHTRTHRRLSELASRPDELDDEVRGSKQEIEDRLSDALHLDVLPDPSECLQQWVVNNLPLPAPSRIMVPKISASVNRAFLHL